MAATLWQPSTDDEARVVAVINAGMGIPASYYARFAAWLADRGVPTLIYDYRGIGDSRPLSLRGFTASVEEWGSKDCAAMLRWVESRYPAAERAVICHSIGAFVTGFVRDPALVDRMILVGGHTGYYGDYAWPAKPAMYLLWHVVMPSITRIFGYFPGQRLHLLEDLPAGIALEWAARRRPDFWWTVKTASGEPDLERIAELRARFQSIHARTLALRFTDDPFATEAATDRILGLYGNAAATRLTLRPSDTDGHAIGHFGFFRSRYRTTLWPQVLGWLR